MTGQYYLRARYYNPVIARFTQEDTYYGDGLNLYTYCQNNPILNHDPTGHGTKENSPYSRKEQQYIDAGADPDTAKLETQCYPDAKSKQDLYNKCKSQGYNATDAKKLANYEIVHGEERAKNYAANNVKKSGPDYTATSPRENPNTDWRTQNRLNAQREAGVSKTSYGESSGNISELLENHPELTGTNREKLLSMVQDTKLAAYINEVYRPGASVGDGGAADKLIMEFYEGSSRHLPKAKERLVGINRIIDSGKLGLNDLGIAEALRDDLEYAIDLFK